MVEKANAATAVTITAQIFPRPIGLVIGLELSGNPFVMYPSYREIADLPLAERVAEMRKPEVRDRILADKPAADGHPLMFAAQAWDWIFPLGDRPTTSPTRRQHRRPRPARGVSPMEEAYDRLLDDDGHAMLLVTLANFRERLAGHRRRTGPPRRRRARPRRRRRALRNDLRRKLSHVHADALGARPRRRAG